jgi:aspartate racemase
MGPTATAEFLRLLAAGVPGTADQAHPRLLMVSDPGIPDRTAALLAGGRGLVQRRIVDNLLTLAGWGAHLLAVPCNTAHVFIEDARASLPVPLVDIVDATLDAAIRTSPAGGWLAASTGTVTSGLYQRRAATLGYHVALPDGAAQAAIHDASLLVKANRLDAAGRRLAEAAIPLWERHDLPLLAACTELPLAYTVAGLPSAMMISSLGALARACVDHLYGR